MCSFLNCVLTLMTSSSYLFVRASSFHALAIDLVIRSLAQCLLCDLGASRLEVRPPLHRRSTSMESSNMSDKSPAMRSKTTLGYLWHSSNFLEHLFHMFIRQICYGPQNLVCRGVLLERQNFGHSTCGASANQNR